MNKAQPYVPVVEPHHIPSHLTTPLSLNDIPPRVAQTMENEESWDFDIFSLEAATMKRFCSLIPISFYTGPGSPVPVCYGPPLCML